MPITTPPQLTAQLVVRFRPEDRERLEAIAARDRRPAAQWIRATVLEALDREESRA